MKARIGILTTFTGCDSAYSLTNVVRTQLEMLIKAGYNPVLFVSDGFTEGEGVYSSKHTEIRQLAKYNAEAYDILTAMREKMEDINIIFAHDIMFLSPQHDQWAEAVKRYAKKRPDIAWIHWQHSRGGGQIKIDLPDNSLVAYPNKGDFEHVAHINKVSKDKVRYVPHALDFKYLGWNDLAIKIAEETNHPFVDVAAVLPTRLDRQKQVERAVRLMAGIKKTGRTISFLIADAYATGERFKDYKRDVIQIAKEQDVERETVFLGERYKECKYATPRETVKALYEMSNLFILPSNAETSSLVAMEASLAGNMLVLNSDFAPILHLYSKAIALPFGSVFEDTKYYRDVKTADGQISKVEDAQLFWDDQARKEVIPALDTQLALAVKRQQLRERWASVIFREHIEPIINEVYKPVTLEFKSAEKMTPMNEQNTDVTAIITTLDNLPLLQRQIPILQEEGVGGIIVVNNGSEDGTAEWLIENFTGSDYVQFINRENFGAGPGRNAGLSLWNMSTPYTLMLDGGILPQRNSLKSLRDYLVRHPDVTIISPEVASCFTGDEDKATRIFPNEILDTWTFSQSCLSSTAYCLCTQKAWDGVRLSEVGPYGQPGWGVDDNDLQYRWNAKNIIHKDIVNSKSGIMVYRRASGSFQRLFKETGVWPNQYGSVYEQRNVLCHQEWPQYHRGLYGFKYPIKVSYVLHNIPMPDFARLVRLLHDKHSETRDEEIVARREHQTSDALWWLDTFALRQTWGNLTFDPSGNKLHRSKEYPEELWSGNVVTWREPKGESIISISMENLYDYITEPETVAT